MAKLDTTDRFPWNEIEDRTVDGQAMVYVPKIYVKNEVVDGKPAWWISNVRKSGYHVHPAFMYMGHETTGVLIGKYVTTGTASAPTSTSSSTSFLTLSLADAQEAGRARNVAGGTEEQHGWHMYNVYEHHLLARLMLIEYGTTDLQNQIGGTAMAMGVSYYGINDVWGQSGTAPYDKEIWIDGLDTLGTDNTKFRILDNLGNGTMVDTGVAYPSSGWVTSMLTDKGDLFDFGDVFVAATTDSTEDNGTFGDSQYFGGDKGSGPFLRKGDNNNDNISGPFGFGFYDYNYYYNRGGPDAHFAFRLCKYV